MTRRPWRVKGDNKNATKMATQPGQIVSMDQLESNSPGLIAQLKGKLTQQRYKYATVFVNQYSGYTFVYLQRRLTSKETVQAVENLNTRLFLISCSQGILSSSSFSFYLLLRLLVYMYLSQLMRTFTNYLKCIVISS